MVWGMLLLGVVIYVFCLYVYMHASNACMSKESVLGMDHV
jgi:hypothetical protein